jgi:uncharacterized protein (DUF2249 family)
MKDRIIDCICEITKAYSLESEWTPEIETEIKKVSRFSEGKLLSILHDYNPKGVLYHLDVEVNDSYSVRLYNRFRQDTNIRQNIIRKYNL